MTHPYLEAIENSGLGTWVREGQTIWAFPTILVLHTIGMGIVAGGAAMLSLILLGYWPAVPKKPFDRVFPWLWAGFWLNAATGILMLIGDTTAKLTMLDFYIKMALVFAGIYLLVRMRRQVFKDPKIDEHPVTGQAKMLAWASLACWFGAITAGRLMAYVK